MVNDWRRGAEEKILMSGNIWLEAGTGQRPERENSESWWLRQRSETKREQEDSGQAVN